MKKTSGLRVTKMQAVRSGLTDIESAARFVFVLGKAPVDGKNSAVTLSEQDIEKFPCVAKTIKAILRTLPPGVAPWCCIRGATIELILASSEAETTELFGVVEVNTFAERWRQSLNCTATELKKNANNDRPLPLKEAVSSAAHIKVLSMLASGHRKSGMAMTLNINKESFDLPILDPSDFTDAEPVEESEKKGTFRIRGVYRGERDGEHELTLEGRLQVALLDGATWDWKRIEGCLNQSTYLVGTLLRESANGAWSLGDSANLVMQDDIL